MDSKSWAESVLSIANRCDSWSTSSSSNKSSCIPLYCSGVRVGLIKPNVLESLICYPHVFEVVQREGDIERVQIAGDLKDVQERTAALNTVFAELRDKGAFPCLKGWRNEDYSVSEMFSSTILFHCERAAARLLGVKQYGVHMNGFVVESDGSMKMWIGRRSLTKQTYPGLLDNTVAGGIAAGSSPLETLVKECEEEASLPPHIARTAKPVGTISYCYEAEDGIEPETEFMFDLQLPSDFVPTPSDGEVSDYYLWNIEKRYKTSAYIVLECFFGHCTRDVVCCVIGPQTISEEIKQEIASGHFKPNCALVVLKFLIRHGLITPETEPLYEVLASCGHLNHFNDPSFNVSVSVTNSRSNCT